MEGLTFKPKINARSAEKHSDQHFSERLYNKEGVAKRREKEFKCVVQPMLAAPLALFQRPPPLD